MSEIEGRATKAEMADIHGLLAAVMASELRKAVKDKKGIDASYANAIRGFLKDNGISAAPGVSRDQEALKKAVEEAQEEGVFPVEELEET